jgi:hypothetical protein
MIRMMRRRRLILLSVSTFAAIAVAAPGSAGATPAIALVPEVSSGGLGGLGSINATVHMSGAEYGGFPAPVAGLVLRLPSGTTLSAGDHSTCSKATLEQTGPSGCLKSSEAGPVGNATGIVSFGDERVEETATVQSFFAPGGGLNFFLNGHSPVSLEILASATVAANVLTIDVPLVSTVPGAPFASLTEVEFRLGQTQPEEEGSGLNSGLILPPECSGRLAWSASVTFDEEGANPIIPEIVESAAETGCPGIEQGPRKRETPTQKRAEEEATIKKHQQEEAELVALRAEVKRLQQELTAAVKVENVKATAKGVRVTIKTSEPGTVRITGLGLMKLTRSLAAGTYHVTVGLTKFGRSERMEHRKIRLSVILQVDNKRVSASRTIKL